MTHLDALGATIGFAAAVYWFWGLVEDVREVMRVANEWREREGK